MKRSSSQHTRRRFLERSIALGSGIPLLSPLLAPPARAGSGSSLSPQEAAFTETLVNALCPADHLTPNGVDCGLATFMDRQLCGNFGSKVSTRPPLTQTEFFKAGVRVANAASLGRFGVRFDQLPVADANHFWRDIAGGRIASPHFPLDVWLEQVVNPLLIQASFNGPIYEDHSNRVFWKLFSHT